MVNVTINNSLCRLVYFSAFSDVFSGAEGEQDQEITKIIRQSIRNNKASDVTGLLLVHQRWFVQALEGTYDAVFVTFGRIRSDARHHAATVIGVGPVLDRKFPNWNMCARRFSKDDDAILQALDLKGTFEPHKLTADKALALLTAVKTIQSRKP